MARIRIEPQPPIDAKIWHPLLFDRVWFADSPAWNPVIDGIEYPNVINSPWEMSGDDSVKAVLENGVWFWEVEEGE